MKFLLPLLFLLPLASQAAQSFERDVPRIHAYSYVMSQQDNQDVVWRFGGDKDDNLYYRGFSITNLGPNHIITEIPGPYLETPMREFYFKTDDMSRRDTYMWVTDYNGSGNMSDFMESIFVFLPRVVPMSIEDQGENFEVTISTTEKIKIFKKYKTLDSDILKEGPVDLNPNRRTRNFADIKYSGTGLIIRSNAKGADPRLGGDVEIIKGDLKPCFIEASVFWTQEDYPRFKFIHDQDAYRAIEKHCGPQYTP